MAELNVLIVGAAGYTGGEMLRLLMGHPRIGRIDAHSKSNVGKPWSAAHPNLIGEKRCFLGGDIAETAAGKDVIFLCLPHGDSAKTIRPIIDVAPQALIVDLAADFRLDDPRVYEQYYGPHPSFDLCETFTYALVEANRDAVASSRRLACPGCFATGALLPLVAFAGTDAIDGLVISFAVTGSSGSGALPKPGTHHPHRNANLCAYKIFSHQHEPEILRQMRAMNIANPLRLTTHSGPFVRGIFTTIHAHLKTGWDEAKIRDIMNRFDSGNPFIHVVSGSPDLTPVLGTNRASIGWAVNGSEIMLFSAIDNLVKGAAGQAVQAMNVALGFDETEGLDAPGLHPY